MQSIEAYSNDEWCREKIFNMVAFMSDEESNKNGEGESCYASHDTGKSSCNFSDDLRMCYLRLSFSKSGTLLRIEYKGKCP